MKKNEVYTELSVQIGVLEAKVDKILQILLEGSKGVNVGPIEIKSFKDILPEVHAEAIELFRDLVTNEEFDREFK